MTPRTADLETSRAIVVDAERALAFSTAEAYVDQIGLLYRLLPALTLVLLRSPVASGAHAGKVPASSLAGDARRLRRPTPGYCSLKAMQLPSLSWNSATQPYTPCVATTMGKELWVSKTT